MRTLLLGIKALRRVHIYTKISTLLEYQNIIQIGNINVPHHCLPTFRAGEVKFTRFISTSIAYKHILGYYEIFDKLVWNQPSTYKDINFVRVSKEHHTNWVQ